MPDNFGYYRMPTLSGEKIVFVSENDLWEVSRTGGVASRLTTSLGAVSYPKFSPDGKWIAFSSTDEGVSDVYVMPASGGPIKRLTYLGHECRIRGWSLDGKNIIFASTAKARGISDDFFLFKVPFTGGEVIDIPVGIAQHIHYSINGFAVLGRFRDDNARWKRYKGGTAGDILIDSVGNGIFKPLLSLKGNLVLPHFYNNQILFLSDHEGISNLYSVNFDGSGLKKLTNQQDYYVRFYSILGDSIVYQSGADIFLLNLSDNRSTKISISLPSMRVQKVRKFVDANTFLENFTVSRDFTHLLTTIRGKIFHFGFWEGGINQLGKMQGVRYKFSVPLSNELVALFSDESGDYKIEIFSLKDYKRLEILNIDIGIPYYSKASSDGKFIALTNHRFELLLIDLSKKSSKIVTKDGYRPIFQFSWSPDNKWLSYSIVENNFLSSIYLFNIEDEKEYQITPSEFQDFYPAFDPKGRYLYFITLREFNSTLDNQYFRHIFPKGHRICAINLSKGTEPPFILKPKILKSLPSQPPNTKSDEISAVEPLKIDLDGIQRRITMFPLEDSIYDSIDATDDRLFYTTRPVLTNNERGFDTSNPIYSLHAFKLESLESVIIEPKMTSFQLADDKKTLAINIGKKIKIIPYDFEQKPGSITPPDTDSSQTPPSRKNGFIDLKRIKVLIEPELEWKQMLRETWRLMKENYWEPTIHGLDWYSVFTKYEKLISKVTTRDEFSDLVWEMISETGTSHCYESGGDYRKAPDYKQGFFGADFNYNSKENGYIVSKIYRGDNWNIDISSPLDTPGTEISEGDIILAINGLSVSENISIGELLANLAGQFVNITVRSSKTKEIKNLTVKTLTSDSELRYRDWVNNNRTIVSKLSNNRLGYIHIPDMMNKGVTEFFRTFKREIRKEGLIVDVRFNRGGNTSQLFLELLSSAQKRIGYNWTRHGKELNTYFMYSTTGPIIGITNEFSGSDGDIFSHNFKLLKIGPLIGKRTWGGVVGIWPKVQLVDGSNVTQPEFSFWFKDVGWGVENYGTDPDIEVEFFPQDYAKNIDPQLNKAVELALEELKKVIINKPTSPFKK